MKIYLKTFIVSFVTLISYNISAQNYAQEFINNQLFNGHKQIIYFSPATELIRTNVIAMDSVSDSVLLNVFNDEIIYQMTYFGLDVKPMSEKPTTLSENESTLEISQVELEEATIFDSIVDDLDKKKVFYKDLTAIKVNVWLTFDKGDENNQMIFYNEEDMQDGFDGYFETDLSKKTYINYSIIRLNPNDAYLMAFDNGKNSGKYFFNFLLNRYVWQKTNGEDKKYYGISDSRTLITNDKPFSNFDVLQEEDF